MEFVMEQECLTIPQSTLLEMLKFQPESVLIKLFDDLFIRSDTSPLSNEEKNDIATAISDYNKGETILWNK
jgi:hypothetical protein